MSVPDFRTRVRVGKRLMRAVIVWEKEGACWLAQVLEKDIQGAGLSPELALEDLLTNIADRVFRAEFFDCLVAAGQERAPQDYWDKFETAIEIPEGVN